MSFYVYSIIYLHYFKSFQIQTFQNTKIKKQKRKVLKKLRMGIFLHFLEIPLLMFSFFALGIVIDFVFIFMN